MVRTRSSARLADHTQPEEASSESNYVSLEKLEKLEKQLGRKRLKTKKFVFHNITFNFINFYLKQ